MLKLNKKTLSLVFAACAVITCLIPLLSCGKRDELGNKYKRKLDGMEYALTELDSARELTEKIENISYEIALMVNCDYADTQYKLGLKNACSITGKCTENSEIYRANTYYGTTDNVSSAHYLHDGYIYTDFCNTLIRVQGNEESFNKLVTSDSMTADTVYFDRSNFSDGWTYEYADGSKAVVLSGAGEDLKKKIADLFGVSSYIYSYPVEPLLRYEISSDGTLESCEMTFDLEYHQATAPNDKVLYKGAFGFDITAVNDEVKVKVPQSGLEYSTVSDLEKLELIVTGYSKLASFTDVAVSYKRHVTNSDASGAVYELSNEAKFTQSYKNEKYTYGSIDVEKSKTPKGSELTSVGIFIDENNMYHYRDFEDKDLDKENTAEAEQWLASFAATLTGESFLKDDLCNITVSESDGIITFTYSYSDEATGYYAEYLLEMFSANKGNTDISGLIITAWKNTGTVKVRLSDGCLIYHSMEFEAAIGYSITVSGSFELEVEAVGDDVKVLTTTDWDNHERKYN